MLCLLVVAAGAGWRLSGGNWAVITTPSMGQAVPVGTLILTRPATLDSIEVGDIVSYRPADATDRLVTHRVTAVTLAGLEVKGDLNGAPDPLPVTSSELAGVVTHIWYGTGWALRAAPILLVTSIGLTLLSARFVALRWRSSIRVIGTCMILSITTLTLRPLVQPVVLAVTTPSTTDITDITADAHTSDAAEPVTANVVSAGLLPSRVTGAHDSYLDLTLGQNGPLPVVPTGQVGQPSSTLRPT